MLVFSKEPSSFTQYRRIERTARFYVGYKNHYVMTEQ